MNTLDDAQLIERVRQGDRNAFAMLYDRYSSLCYGVALRILRREADAEEVLQEAWLYAWRNLANYDASRSRLSTWLVMIARSRALDRYRALQARGPQVEIAVAAASIASEEDIAGHSAEQQRAARVRAAMSALSDKQREALDLAFFEGLSHAEVAERLATPLGTVKSRIRDGLRALAGHLPAEGWR